MQRTFGAGAALFLTLSAASAEAAFVKWDEAAGGNGHYYDVVYVPLPGITFTQARRAVAERYGDRAHLATATSAAENAFIASLLQSGKGVWLGGLQTPDTPDPAAGWTWVTGEPFVFTNWYFDEPNDFWGVAEDFLMMHSGLLENGTWTAGRGMWNDAPDRWDWGYVVESAVVPLPVPALLLGSGLLALVAMRRSRGGGSS